MANIREIAKRAGVSVTTVSRVLNEHPYVKEEKRERVLQAMKELKYTKHPGGSFSEGLFEYAWHRPSKH